jgi:phospholipid-binding lipoprotein MlaA
MAASIVRGVVPRGIRTCAALLGGLALWTVAAGRAVAQDPLDDQLAALDAADSVASYPDPIEPVNRASLGFNEQLDRFLIEPVSDAYSAVMPDQAELAVRRAFRNLSEPISFVNHGLRLEPRLAGETLARFVMNTVGGVGGLIDVATPAGLPEHRADFGGTLHRYGTPSGPYLVVPVMGPSTARDAVGDLVDAVVGPQRYLLSGASQLALGTGNGISSRTEHGEALDALREQSVDFYAALRAAYYLSRESELAGTLAGPSADFSSSAATSASNPSRSSTDVYSARRSASSDTVPSR